MADKGHRLSLVTVFLVNLAYRAWVWFLNRIEAEPEVQARARLDCKLESGACMVFFVSVESGM